MSKCNIPLIKKEKLLKQKAVKESFTLFWNSFPPGLTGSDPSLWTPLQFWVRVLASVWALAGSQWTACMLSIMAKLPTALCSELTRDWGRAEEGAMGKRQAGPDDIAWCCFAEVFFIATNTAARQQSYMAHFGTASRNISLRKSGFQMMDRKWSETQCNPQQKKKKQAKEGGFLGVFYSCGSAVLEIPL